ncbi:hypothetical protein GCM10009555_098170 [Acrocarpospora macrocephala]|uniref:Uncharacterized protein n=1 Tax=Acrocarpospora macrocephala TaxID=150177 RepID=A0A5M3WWJ6_9ACTN|nr:hypothetical protein [Acrocarpospora macrocephala]GES12602.1 hypothetical protein Amac_061990 [Acrocarpospora macrocephala]
MLEGLSRVDDPDDDYEAADVGEYIGGDNFDNASAVLLSQLRYSTRHSDKAWTVSRLCAKRTKRTEDGGGMATRSVIADLAGVYAKLLTGRSREQVLSKVRMAWVMLPAPVKRRASPTRRDA